MELVWRFFLLFMCLISYLLFFYFFPVLNNLVSNGTLLLEISVGPERHYIVLLLLYLFFAKLFHKIRKIEFPGYRPTPVLVQIVATTGISTAIMGIIVSVLLFARSI